MDLRLVSLIRDNKIGSLPASDVLDSPSDEC